MITKSTIFLLFCSLTNNLIGQKTSKITKGKIIIPIHKEIDLKATLNSDKIADFELLSETDLTEPFNIMTVLDDKPENFGDIMIKFNNSDFGVILVLVHKFEKSLIYKARIKIIGRNDFIETTIHRSTPNAISVEQWKDDIEEIELSEFRYYKE